MHVKYFFFDDLVRFFKYGLETFENSSTDYTELSEPVYVHLV